MEKAREEYGKLDDSGSKPPVKEFLKALAKDVKVELRLALEVEPIYGLTSDTKEELRRICGLIDLDNHESPSSIWSLILEQFENAFFWVLLAVIIVSIAIAWNDFNGRMMGIVGFVVPLLMFLILVVAVAVQVWHESNAEKALLEALKEIQSEQATVTCEGKKISPSPAKIPSDMGVFESDKLHGEVEEDSSWVIC